mgnify:CR=1 FL=1
MNIITIPKKLAQKGDLVLIPRKEYEALLAKNVKEFIPTASEKRAIARAKKDYDQGKYITLQELKNELASRRT